MSLLNVAQVTKDYGLGENRLSVLRGVDLSVDAGTVVAIVGPSGCGKSTLLQILGTLDQPTTGSVTLAGQNPFALRPRELSVFRNQQIGFVFQDHQLLPQLSVWENVLLPTLAAGGTRKGEADRAAELLQRVGLGHRLEHRPSELSGGERQRAAVARALIRSPKLVLADEPTGNLDRKTAQEISELLLELPKSMASILIVVTHSLELAARCQLQLELVDGHLQPVNRQPSLTV